MHTITHHQGFDFRFLDWMLGMLGRVPESLPCRHVFYQKSHALDPYRVASDVHQGKQPDREMPRPLLKEEMAEIDHGAGAGAGASVLRRRGVLGDCRPVQGVYRRGVERAVAVDAILAQSKVCLVEAPALPCHLRDIMSAWVLFRSDLSQPFRARLGGACVTGLALALGEATGSVFLSFCFWEIGVVQVAASWWTARSAPVLHDLLALVLSLVIL